jgi:phospholipase C
MTVVSRRQVLQAGVAAGAGLAAGLPRHVLEALAAPAQCGSLHDIQHVVILVQENRSFDSYFGTYRGVAGFNDPNVLLQADGTSVFEQPGYNVAGFNGRLFPFRLDTQTKTGECTNDITHDWGPQHQSWHGGLMDAFVSTHVAADPVNGPLTMGYMTREDLPFYHALADAFTICDHYHCSVIGPTDPNRLYTMTGTLDPDGTGGGPHLTTLVSTRAEKLFQYTWKTMPEVLQEAGVSWKVYGNPDGNYGDNVLAYFKAYTNPLLAANAFVPSFPGTFELDCIAGTLPQVSWVLAPLVLTEHPPAAVTQGEWATAQVLNALTQNRAVWEKTVLFVTYDENGGFFDHVPPPTAPAGTPGEYLTVNPLPAAAAGIAGPIGLGFRVPMLVASPFSRGGFVYSGVVDHTSTLRFLETRFGVVAPNISAWRRATVGDLTGALNVTRNNSLPTLPQPSLLDQRVLSECIPAAIISEADESSPLVPTYPVPPNHLPQQEAGTAPQPTGICATSAAPAASLRGASGGSLVAAASGGAAIAGLPNTAGAGAGSGAAVVAAAAVLAGVGWLGRRKAELAAREDDGEG